MSTHIQTLFDHLRLYGPNGIRIDGVEKQIDISLYPDVGYPDELADAKQVVISFKFNLNGGWSQRIQLTAQAIADGKFQQSGSFVCVDFEGGETVIDFIHNPNTALEYQVACSFASDPELLKCEMEYHALRKKIDERRLQLLEEVKAKLSIVGSTEVDEALFENQYGIH